MEQVATYRDPRACEHCGMRHDAIPVGDVILDVPESDDTVAPLASWVIDPGYDEGTSVMRFRLTYSGTLLGATQKNTRAQHKHDIRRVFHPQLRALWRERPYLNTRFQTVAEHKAHGLPDIPKEFADRFRIADYNFVPLVVDNDEALVGIEVLFLRPGPIGVILQSGDLDNRLSTLFDALQMPQDKDGFGKNYALPAEDEVPFYCLLQNDKLIGKVSVETDVMLEPLPGKSTVETNDARLIITVDVRSSHPLNTRFAG